MYSDLEFDVLADGPFEITKISVYGGFLYDPSYTYHFICNHGKERRWSVSGGIKATLDLGELGVERVVTQVGDLVTIKGEKWNAAEEAKQYRNVKGDIKVGPANVAKVVEEAKRQAEIRKEAQLAAIRARAHSAAKAVVFNNVVDRLGERALISRLRDTNADLFARVNEETNVDARFSSKEERAAFSKARSFAISKGAYATNEAMVMLHGHDRTRIMSAMEFGTWGIPEDFMPKVITAMLHGLREGLNCK